MEALFILQQLFGGAANAYQDRGLWHEQRPLQERLLSYRIRMPAPNTMDGLGICSFGKPSFLS